MKNLWAKMALAGLLVSAALGSNGVPRLDPSYGMDIEQWWLSHPYNPQGPNYDPVITSPSTTVTLNPGGSIQTAINSLPSGGGTIIINPGTYGGSWCPDRDAGQLQVYRWRALGGNHLHLYHGRPRCRRA